MTLYYPNIAEKEMLKDKILSQGLVLGLYKNLVVGSGSLTMDNLEELPSTGGRGYARIALTNDLVEGALAANKWAISLNADDKAQAQYHNAPLEFAFNDYDVADGNTVQGAFAFTWVLPFDAGAKQIKVGDTIKGATSLATGIVTMVEVQSGTWGAGTAAGNLKIMTKTGTFQDNENILVLGEVGTLNATPTNGGTTGYAVGDLVQITTGGVGALAIVATVNAGSVTSIYLATGGHGYTTGTGKATAKITGSGDDTLTVNITALASAAYAVVNTGTVGDALIKLRFIEPATTPQAIVSNGQKVTYVPLETLSTA